MLFAEQPLSKREIYIELLSIIGSLSNLFSENDKPYLPYRATERIFCLCFDAEDLSRADSTADAALDNIGIGIKTFINTPVQKIAEFNSLRHTYRDLNDKEKIKTIADYRNERIAVTMRKHKLNEMIYHYTYRTEGLISGYECPMHYIDTDNIIIDDVRGNIVYFNDGINVYQFNDSKSTLFMRFKLNNPIFDIDVDIIPDPFTLLLDLFRDITPETEKETLKTTAIPKHEVLPYVILPLYSTRTGKVPEKSGLNQWNACGRKRKPDEVYIPVPVKIREQYPDFFPPKDVVFRLQLPDKKNIQAKICQEDNKALMSNPNTALGHWLLRDVLQLSEGTLVTNEILNTAGIDSAVIYKHNNAMFSIDFCALGGYADFTEQADEEDVYG